MPGAPKKRQRREAAAREAILRGEAPTGLRGEAPTGITSPRPPSTTDLLIAGDPAFQQRELTMMEEIAASASPEEFQRAFGLLCRKLIVRGLQVIPVPRTIKELQAVADMIRKSEGMDGKGNGMPTGGLVAPRRVVRGKVGETVVDVAPEEGVVTEGEPESPESESPESESPESESPESESSESESPEPESPEPESPEPEDDFEV